MIALNQTLNPLTPAPGQGNENTKDKGVGKLYYHMVMLHMKP